MVLSEPRKGSDMESLVERFEAFGEFCVIFFGFPWEKHRRNMEKHAKTWKHNGCIVDNYDVLMCNVIYLILYEWETTMYSNPQ